LNQLAIEKRITPKFYLLRQEIAQVGNLKAERRELPITAVRKFQPALHPRRQADHCIG
jgi:hypothetical protein